MVLTKEIAARLDIHPKTFKRTWLKRLGILPAQSGHGPHKWTNEQAAEIERLFNSYYTSRGTSAELTRAKYAGTLRDSQPALPFTSFIHVKKTHEENQKPKAKGR